MMPSIRHQAAPASLALIGAGRMGSAHAQAISESSVLDLRVIVDQRTDSAEYLARQVSTTSMQQAAFYEGGFAEVDAIVIATPTDTHYDVLSECLSLGKPVFCEKPLAASVQSSAECLRLIAGSHLRVQVGLMRRFDPALVRFRRLLDDGVVGRPRAIRIVTHDEHPPAPEYRSQAGSIFADMMIHDFDLVHWLLRTEIVKVAAVASFFTTTADFTDPDLALSSFTTSSGVGGTIQCSRHDPDGYRFEVTVHGSTGSLSLSELELSGGPVSASASDRFAVAYMTQLEAFADQSSPVEANASDAHNALIASDGAHRAWSTGVSQKLQIKGA